jgi:predicted HTH domain antitoxin
MNLANKEERVLKLFKEGKISSGYGAKLLGLNLADFMDLLKEKGIPFTQYTKEDWDKIKKQLRKWK